MADRSPAKEHGGEDLDYVLPRERIALVPPDRREDARLLVLDPPTGAIEHEEFPRLVNRLVEGDVLVLNDTRVIPARLRARRPSGGAAEILLLRRERSESRWYALARPRNRLRLGTTLTLPGEASARVVERGPSTVLVELDTKDRPIETYLDRWGEPPVPPYVRRREGDPRIQLDRERYQTAYAKNPGSIAAPTAGLHFTPEILAALHAKGVETCFITLHVGRSTFLSLDDLPPGATTLPPEIYDIPEETAHSIARAAEEGRRVVAVGTTVTRTLEDAFAHHGSVPPGRAEASIFIRPGHRFKVVSALLTNFHQPRTTVFALACAFAGTDFLKRAYAEAIEKKYRFLSYGDAVLMLRPQAAGP
ncbi:MAG: tRNA preQ1(34) S-adenosylmethionine ribosyltransferase-isomerase QueA [Nitrospirae bacterium]|nr:tRNA preQ1(34) S-adenosylmethionine ribosyltransferase-isomerase QueA [Nitrospirota bacterium]